MKKKLIPLIAIFAFLLVLVGGAVAYPSSIESFLGGSHGGCHVGNGPTTESAGATVTVVSVQGTSLTAGQEFTVNVVITNFTEALTIDRDSQVSVAVASTRGDNAEFGKKLSDPIRLAGITLDNNGDANVSVSFDLLAPSIDGTYNLVVDVLTAANHTDGSALNIIYATGNVVLTVSGGVSGGIPGFEIYTLIGVLAVTTSVIIVIFAFWKKRKHFF